MLQGSQGSQKDSMQSLWQPGPNIAKCALNNLLGWHAVWQSAKFFIYSNISWMIIQMGKSSLHVDCIM